MEVGFALVGAGGMGMRHAHGYLEARRVFAGDSDRPIPRMAAICDVHEAVANAVADVVESGTGERPRVFTDFDRMIEAAGGGVEIQLEAISIATSTPMHHRLAERSMEAGLHVMTEKPMGLTLRACKVMSDAAARTGRVLSVAENYRRDPMNRLARALLLSGVIGRPYFALDMHLSSAGDGVMHSTVWRAKKDQAGGNVLDAGVHNADMLLYLLGPVERVYAATAVNERKRRLNPMSRQAPGLAAMYSHRREDGVREGEMVEQDAVDTAFAVLTFESGAAGQLSLADTSHGQRVGISTISGSLGTLTRAPSRSGRPVRVVFGDGREVEGDALLEMVPDFELDDVTAALWDGRRRMGSYDYDFREIDSKILALEYMELMSAVAEGSRVEVGPEEGAAALALAYAVVESGDLGEPVRPADVAACRVEAYQMEINEAAGI